MAAVSALEGNNPNQRRNQFTRSPRSRLQYTVLMTPRTSHLLTRSSGIFRLSGTSDQPLTAL